MRRNVSSKFIADVYEGNWKWIKVSQNSLLKANHISTETIKKSKIGLHFALTKYNAKKLKVMPQAMVNGI